MRDRVATQDRTAILGSLQKASAARRNLPARAVRPDHLAELRIPVPDRDGVLAEITSLAAGARHRHLRHRDRALGRGPARRPHPHRRRRRRRDAPGRRRGAPATAAGPSSSRDGTARPRRRRRRRRAAARCARRGRSRSRTASVLLGALAEGTSVIHGLSDGADVAASLAAVEAMGAGVERHDDGTVVVHGRPGPAAPARRAARLRQLGDLHAPAGRAGGRVRLGDRAGRRRLAVEPAHGPRGRAARAHGGHGHRAGARAACRRCASAAARCRGSTGPPRWPAPR